MSVCPFPDLLLQPSTGEQCPVAVTLQFPLSCGPRLSPGSSSPEKTLLVGDVGSACPALPKHLCTPYSSMDKTFFFLIFSQQTSSLPPPWNAPLGFGFSIWRHWRATSLRELLCTWLLLLAFCCLKSPFNFFFPPFPLSPAEEIDSTFCSCSD